METARRRARRRRTGSGPRSGLKVFLLAHALGFASMGPGESVPVLPFFNLVMVWNPGISYGLFPVYGRWILLLVGLSVVAVGILTWLLWRASSRSLAIGYGLIIGGALGNDLVDRVIYGKVARFLPPLWLLAMTGTSSMLATWQSPWAQSPSFMTFSSLKFPPMIIKIPVHVRRKCQR